jgi:hypothetical protein
MTTSHHPQQFYNNLLHGSPRCWAALLGPTLAALDQLPDEVLLQIMISVEVRSRKQ